MEQRLLTLKEAARYISHSEGTLRNLISAGKLPFPFAKAGRKVLIDRRDLDNWIDSLPKFGAVNR